MGRVSERLINKTPHGRCMTTTPVAAFDARGVRCAIVVHGAVNRDIFEAFVEKGRSTSASPATA